MSNSNSGAGCKYCNVYTQKGYKFCGVCGNSLISEPEKSQIQRQRTQKPKVQNNSRKVTLPNKTESVPPQRMQNEKQIPRQENPFIEQREHSVKLQQEVTSLTETEKRLHELDEIISTNTSKINQYA